MKNILANLEYIKDLAWSEVFEIWRADEEGSAAWEAHWRERGFDSWEEWRERYVGPLKLRERGWKLYRVIEPAKTVPLWRGGPFKSWVEKFYDGEAAPAFEELMKKPELREHDGLRRMAKDFPKETTVSAVMTDDGIVVVEGMHRCCAVTLGAAEGRDVAKSFYLALGDHLPGELEVVGRFKK